MPTYIHDLPNWPWFIWNHEMVAAPLAAARHKQGRLLGQMEALGFKVKEEAVLRTLTDDVLKSSEIEGEKLDADQVRSSLARRLGMDVGGLKPADRDVEGVVEMMLDATQRYDHPLTQERLLGWHAALFPTGRSGMHPIGVGAWRDDRTAPMQVVSGPLAARGESLAAFDGRCIPGGCVAPPSNTAGILGRRASPAGRLARLGATPDFHHGLLGRERVHFEAPAAARLQEEMRRLLAWFNDDVTTEPVLKAAQAHLWFVTIHPIDDGNGRIGRAIADMALARSEGSSQRFYSMSAQIRQERGDYYRILEQTQQGTMDITPWMEWFLGCLTRAIEGARSALSGVITKSRYWERLRDVPLNDRQRQVINRLLDGFEGKLTTSKWAALTKSSQDTALRDIQQLVDRGVLVRNPAGGRSTSYSLAAVS